MEDLDARGALFWVLVDALIGSLASLGVSFKGDLKGERKGLDRVWEAWSILRRLAAGVDILIVS